MSRINFINRNTLFYVVSLFGLIILLGIVVSRFVFFQNDSDKVINSAPEIFGVIDPNPEIPVNVDYIGHDYKGAGEMQWPQDIVLDSQGNSYVVDYFGRVQKFDASGVLLQQFGTLGTADGQLTSPNSVALDNQGNLYVTDISKIQKFDSAGTYLSKLVSPDPSIKWPLALAINSVGDIYVGYFQNFVEVYNSAGVFQFQFGSAGSGDGQFGQISGIEFDGSNNVYISDVVRNRIQKFTNSGVFVSKLGTTGTGPGQFDAPNDVFVNDTSGDIYVADSNNDRIQVFNSSGVYQSEFGSVGSEDGQLKNPVAVVANAVGEMFVVEYENFRVQKFSSTGDFVSKFGSNAYAPGMFINPAELVIDNSGKIYVSDSYNERIQVFDSERSFLFQFGTQGSGNGQFMHPEGIAVNSLGAIYVVDSANHRVQYFDSSGNYSGQFGTRGSADGQFDFPSSLYIDSSNKLYVTDRVNRRVQVFDSAGNFLYKFGSSGSGNGQFSTNNIFSITVDQIGKVYVGEGNKVHVFDNAGNFLFRFGSFGQSDGQFFGGPYGVSVAENGDIITGDSCSMQRFDSAGVFLWKYGSCAEDPTYSDVVIDPQGSDFFFALDGEAHRLEVLTLDKVSPEIELESFPLNTTTDTSPSFVGNSTDALTPITSVQVSIDGGNYANCAPDDGIYDEKIEEFHCSLAYELDLGAHQINIRSADSKGNLTEGTEIFSYSYTIVEAPTPTNTPTPTSSATATPTTSGTTTPTATGTTTLTSTPSETVFPTDTPSSTLTGEVTPTFGITDTPSKTVIPPPTTTATAGCVSLSVLESSVEFIQTGGAVDIMWESQCNDGLVMNPGGVILAAKGVTRVTPLKTTTYVFTPRGKPGIFEETVTIKVFDTLPWTGTIAAGSGLLLLEAVVALQQPTIFGNIWLSLAGLVRKKKRNTWGVVYDSVSKKPLGRVVIRLKNSEGNVTDTAVTDANGVFKLAAKPGSYSVLAQLSGYDFPSKTITSGQDGSFGSIYSGGLITLAQATSGLLVSIPLDPANLTEEERKKIQVRQKVPIVIELLTSGLMGGGFIYAMVISIMYPHPYNTALLAVYALMSISKLSLFRNRTTQGHITDKQGNPIKNMEVGLYDVEFHTLLYRTFTNEEGAYSFIVPNTSYELRLLDRQPRINYKGNIQDRVLLPKRGGDSVRYIGIPLVLE